jgi:hypothetical protein
VVSGGIGTLAVVGVTAWISPRLRAFGALNEARPEGEEIEGEAPIKGKVAESSAD